MINELRHNLLDNFFHIHSINSTSSYSEKLIKENRKLGNFLVVADTQHNGIGRKGHDWHSPQGGLWFTLSIYNLPINSALSLFVGICVQKTLIKLYPDLNVQLKWPNDIFLNGLKVGGILCNYLPNFDYHMIGIGINSAIDSLPEELQEVATSIKLHKSEVDNEEILRLVLDHLDQGLPQFICEGFENMVDYFNANSFLKGKTVVLGTEFKSFKGVVTGVNKQGALLLKLPSGMIQPFYSGSILEIL